MRTRTVLKHVAFSLAFSLALAPLSPLDLYAAELTSSQRQERVKSGFQKGKSFYDAGRYEEAFAQWDEIAPFLEPGSSVQKVIDFLKKRSGRTIAPSSAPKVAAAPAPAAVTSRPSAPSKEAAPLEVREIPAQRAAAPKELPELLERASEKLEQDAKAAEARKALAQNADSERTARLARVDAAIEKGKTYYYEDNLAKALDEWESVASEFEDGARVEALIREARLAQKRLEDASSSSVSAAPAAAVDSSELSDLLKTAGRRLDKEIAAAEAKRGEAEKASSRKVQESRAVSDAFKSGKAAYEAGRYDEALAEWERLRDSEQVPAGFSGLLDDFKAGLGKLERARREAAAPPASSAPVSGRTGITAGEMERFFGTASQRFESEVSLAIAAKRRAEAGTAGGAAAVSDAFEKGRLLYYQGRYDEALAEWEALLPQIADGEPLRATIQGLKEKRRQMQGAEKEAARLSKAGLAKPSMPEELPKLLDQAEKKIQNEIWRLQTEKTRQSEDRESRQAEIRRRAGEARDLFDKGRTEEAIQRWEGLLPLFEDPAPLKTKVDALKLQAQNASLLKKSVADLEASRKSASLPADEVLSYVDQAKRRLDEEVLSRETERRRVNEAVTERQKRVDAAFENGKKLYGLGRYDEAIAEWDKLLPYLGPESRARLESLEKGYEASRRAKREAEAAAASTAKLRAPSELDAALESASKTLVAELGESKKKQAEAERDFVARQSGMLAAYEKGKTLFADGRYTEAAREWEKLAAYDERYATRLETMKRAAAEASSARQTADRVTAEGRSKVETSVDQIAASLAEAAEQMRAEALRADEARLAAEKDFESRKGAMAAAYEKGKSLFAAGRSAEALGEWDKLAAYDPRYAARLETMKRVAAEASVARQKADRDIAAGRDRAVASADEISASLAEAAQGMRTEALRAEEARRAAEKDFQSRQSGMAAAYQKGKAFYAEGRYAEASLEWEKLASYDERYAPRLETMKLAAAEASVARQAADRVTAEGRGRVEVSADQISAALGEASEQMKIEAVRAAEARAAAEKDFAARQGQMRAAHEKGRSLFAAGRAAEALREWEKLAPYDSRLEASLKELKRSADEATAARRSVDRYAAESRESDQGTADQIAEALAQATVEMKAESARSAQARAAAENEFSARQGSMRAAYEKGKQLFAARRYAEAAAEWEKLAPYDKRFAANFKDLKRTADEASAALREADRASAEGRDGIQASTDQIEAALTRAAEEMRADGAEAARARAASENEFSARQGSMLAAYEKGKQLFAARRYAEAAAEWEKLAPYDNRFAVSLKELKRSADEALSSRQAAEQAFAQSKGGIQASSDQIAEALVRAAAEMNAESVRSAEARAAAEKDFESRQGTMRSAYEKGKSHFAARRYVEAAGEWDKLAPYDSRFAVTLKELTRSASQAAAARREADKVSAESHGEIRASTDEISAALSQATAEMKAESIRSAEARAAAEKDFAARRGSMRSAYEKGRSFFAARRYAEAAAEWEKLAPHDGRFVEALKALRPAAEQAAAARQDAERVSAEGRSGIQISTDQIAAALGQAAEEMRAESIRSAEARAAAEKDFESRQGTMRSAYEKGKSHFAAGRYVEAAGEWDKLAPYDARFTARLKELGSFAAAAASARREAERVTSESYSRMKVSADDMLETLSGAEQEMQAQSAKALEQRAQLEKSVAERQAWVLSTFEEGRKLYGAGKREEALELWSSITPHLLQESAVKASLARVAAAVAAASEASRASEAAAVRERERVQVPADLPKLLTDAEAAVAKETESALASKALSEKNAEDRRRSIEETLAGAKQDFEQGKVEAALKKWGSALPALESGQELRPALERLEAAVQNRSRASQALSSAEERKAAKIRAPSDLESVLGDASKKMNADAQATDVRAKQIEEELADRQVWITFTFQDGRKLYDAGKYEEALKVWGTLVPYLENGAQVQALLDGIRKDREIYEQARKTAAGAAARKEAKFRTPPPLSQLLQEMSAKLTRDAAAAKAEEAKFLESAGQQQAAVDAAFGRGKTSFTAGLYDDALKEWESLLPYLAEGPELGRTIQEARGRLAQALEAKRQAAQAAAARETKFKAPADLPKLLAETDARLLQDKKNAEDEKAKLEKARLDRQAWIDATFRAGRDAYAQGKYHEALAEWDKLAVHIDPQAGIREALDRVRKSHESALDAKKNVVQFAAKEYKESRVPEGMAVLLKEADARLKDDVGKFQSEKEASQKSFAERRERLRAGSERAKAFYAEGKLAEAVKEWQGLAADFDPSSPEAKIIASLSAGFAARAEASKSATDAAALQAAPVSLPEGGLALLTEAQKKLYQQSADFLARKDEAAKALDLRKASIASALERAKSAAAAGKIDAALVEWEKLAPEFAESEALRAEVRKARQAQVEASAARAAAESAERAAGGKLKAPEGLVVLVEQVRMGIKKETIVSQTQAKNFQEGRAALEQRVAASFDKTKTLLQNGRAEEAMKEWAGVRPLLEASPALDESLASLEAAIQGNLAARSALAAAAEADKKKIAVPADFAKTLETAALKLQEESRAADAQRAQMEKALADRRAWANSVYQKGRALYAEKKFAEAVAQWEELLSKSEEAAALKAPLDQLKLRLAETAAARKAADDFAAVEYKQLRIPLDDLGKQLADADVKLLENIRTAEAQKAEMQKTLSERQAWVADTFAKGRALFAEGRIREALETWNSLTPYLAEEAKMKDYIARVQAKNEQAVEARRQADAAAAHQAEKFKTPAELTQALTEADQNLFAATKAANDQKALAEKAIEDKKVWIKFTFEDGKNLYAAGKVPEALQLWDTLLPHLENSEKLKGALQSVAQNHAAAVTARKETQEALLQQDQKFAVPEDMMLLLDAARQKLSQDASSSLAQKGKADQIKAERQRWIESAFAEGKSFYDQGRYPEAIKEWVTIVPYLQDEDELKALMEKVSTLHTESRTASEAAEEARQKEGLRTEAPLELYKLLEEASESLRAETERSLTQREEAKKTLEQRQAAVTAAFQKGRSRYESGQVGAAIEEWRAMLPHLAESQRMEAMLKDLGYTNTASEQARTEAKDALSRQNVRLEMPAELFPFLQRANEALKTEALEAQGQKSRAEGNLQERQQWVTATFQQGKVFYNLGQYKEAADEWSKLAPYTDEASGIRELIELVRQNQRQTLEAKTAAVEAVAGDYKGLKLAYTEQMVQLLERANQNMKQEVVMSLKKKEETEAAVAERREWSTTTFNKGKIFYEQERYDEAIDQWSRLAPYLEGDSRARQLIETIKANHEAALAARRDAEAQSGQKPDYEAMSSFFEQAAAKLAADAQNAKIQSAAAEKQFAKRKEWIETTFEKGKQLFAEGRPAEALREWDILRPYLAEVPGLQKQVDEARRRAEEALKAVPAAAQAAAKQQAVPALPAVDAPQPQAEEAVADEVPAEEEAAEDTQAAPEPAAPDAASEFVSGEVTAVDPAEKSITMKLYTVNKEKNLKILFDDSTKIDGGAQNVNALASGIAIDLRYDPQTNKALYIYIY